MTAPTSAEHGIRSEDGVLVQDAVAPAPGRLRPLVRAAPDVFPVYRGLEDRLLKPDDPFEPGMVHPDRTVARTLAVCAGYAYSDAETVSTMMARMGLENNRCRMIALSVDAMFIVSTAFLVQSEDGRVVVLVYRGTQPANLINWLTDADLAPGRVALPVDGQGPYEVHGGFYRNVRATRYKVTEALLRAARGRPVTAMPGDRTAGLAPMEALYVTGHSLGGAMAALQALLLRTVPEHEHEFGGAFRAAYTFGQPMVGSPALAARCDEDAFLGTNVVRFVNAKDPIPHLPPTDTGPFASFGPEYHFDGRSWQRRTGARRADQMRLVTEFVGAGLASAARAFPVLRRLPVTYLLDDHMPQHYIEALTRPGELTEFGDHPYQA